MRVPDRGRQCIGYRLNMIGLRVWSDRCQLVAKHGSGQWEPIGAVRPLPVFVPRDPAGIDADPLLMTAYQYDREHPGCDLVAVLAREKRFEDALLDDANLASP